MARAVALAVIALLLAAPLALRESPVLAEAGTRRLVVITPHGEPIRAEFGRAFAAWAKRERGWAVELDWRTPGGTSEITRYLDERFRTALARLHPEFSREQIRAAIDPKTPADHPARRAFLAAPVSVGVDILFGGGEFPYRGHAAKGYLADPGLLAAEPAWFGEGGIPQMLSGELVYDPQGRYFGACFATFGIVANPDRLADLGLAPPQAWVDLCAPAYRGHLTLADPTKSGAVVTCMERIIQQAMVEGSATAGWLVGLNRIKLLVANSRHITDSASKPTRDVVRGDAVAAMAIDFQARSEAEWSARESGGAPRLTYTVPVGGTSVSADPLAMLRGAPEPELARAFVRFVLSPEGQRLWNYRVGEPGGPQRYCLHRAPVRPDVLTAEDRRRMAEPEQDPFAIARSFTYRPGLTAKLYNLIGPLVKAVALDARDELQAAWAAVCAAGGPQRVPEAMAEMDWLPLAYAEAPAAVEALKDAEKAAPLLRGWTVEAQARYRRAQALAEAGR